GGADSADEREQSGGENEAEDRKPDDRTTRDRALHRFGRAVPARPARHREQRLARQDELLLKLVLALNPQSRPLRAVEFLAAVYPGRAHRVELIAFESVGAFDCRDHCFQSFDIVEKNLYRAWINVV